ncbi:hypothetical protein, partial [Pseudogemmobacter sp. W21_MBD1_M6]|uniref:hypothetical protein n=1 Tax=Pseudogemmobacter sp. W21_MBD1_M6 TaxID=3240271 RepID=UPI003F982366
GGSVTKAEIHLRNPRNLFKQTEPPLNSVKHMMPELGWTKSKVKWGGVDYARGIWVRPGFVIDRGMVIAPDGSKVKLTDNLANLDSGLMDFEVIL